MKPVLRASMALFLGMTLLFSPFFAWAQACYPPIYYQQDDDWDSGWWCDKNWMMLAGAVVAGGIAGYSAGRGRGSHGKGPFFVDSNHTLSVLVNPSTPSGSSASFTVDLITPNFQVQNIGVFTTSPSSSVNFQVTPVLIGTYTVVVTLDMIVGSPNPIVTITPIVGGVPGAPVSITLITPGQLATVIIPITS